MMKSDYTDEATIVANQNIKEREYWINCCTGDFEKSTFPYCYKKNPGENREKSGIQSTWDGQVFRDLMKLSSGVDVKLHMILVTVLNVLLYLYTGKTDLSLGSPVLRQETDGNLINRILMYRSFLKEGMSFKEFLLLVREIIVSAAENQNFPLELLPGILNMTQTETEFPLFDVVLVLENIQDRDYLKGIQYNLLFSFLRTENNVEVFVHYSPWLYSGQYIEGIINHFKAVLSQVLENIECPLSQLEILSDTEKRQLLIEFNHNRIEIPQNFIFTHLFEEQVLKNPHQEAVVLENQETGVVNHLDYNELNEQSNRLAWLLRQKGVTADTIVAIMLERSIEVIIAILSVIKAGGAYLPVDPLYPAERINFIFSDSCVTYLLTKNQPVSGIVSACETVILEKKLYLAGEKRNLPVITRPEHLAYVIYTSGSTGKPKGVLVQHSNLVNAALGWRNEYRLNEMEVNLLQMAGFSFDVSCGDITRALLNGGRMVITPEIGLEPEFLYNLISKYRISLLESTPAYIIPFIKYVYDNCFEIPTLKLLIVGSDSCKVEAFQEVVKKYGKQMRIINSYGVTEATIDSSYFEGEPWELGINGDVPIGKPLPNMCLYVLNSHGCLLPVGVPGELYIGGLGVSRGYMNRPELTAEKFLITGGTGRVFDNRVLQGEQGACTNKVLYRTGDLAQWLPDGNLLFLGRADFQVKIRGFRIELGEIEARITAHPAVKDAVVVERQDGTGDKFLCAYIVASNTDEGKECSSIEWRDYLSTELPEYMIPLYFVQLEKVPLNANGKVDRKSLPEPVYGGINTYCPPRNHLETKLVELWTQVLFGNEVLDTPIGIDDNFFELRGQSLKATVLVYKIHKELQIKLPLVQIFQTPTIRGQAMYIANQRKDTFDAITPVEKKEYYPLSPAQKRLYILQQSQPDSVFYNIPIAVEIVGGYCKERMQLAFNRLIQRHEALRTSFFLLANEPVQHIHRKPPFQIIHQNSTEHCTVASPDSFIRPFDLARAPLFRVGIFKKDLGTDENIILMVDLHHIISDGMSNEILITDFNALYEGEDLVPLRLQYKDAAEWQVNRQKNGTLQTDEDFWLQQFSGPLNRLELPYDFPRTETQGHRGSSVRFAITEEQSIQLRKLATNEKVTLYTLLFTLYNILLFKLSDQEDITIGTTAMGRRHADLETVIGMFVNTLALRNYPQGSMSFLEFLQTVNRRTLDAFEHQDYQFDDLVEKVVPGREPGRNPLFDAVFTFSTNSFKDNSKSGITDSNKNQLITIPYSFGVEEGLTKFDLVLEAVDNPGVISFIFAFSMSLFKPETIERYCNYFIELISEIVKNNEIKLEDIILSSEMEHRTPEIYNEGVGEFEF